MGWQESMKKYADVRFSWEEIHDVLASDEYLGFCLACQACADEVEPDAENYYCSNCGEREVFGAEQILILGLVDTGENSNE